MDKEINKIKKLIEKIDIISERNGQLRRYFTELPQTIDMIITEGVFKSYDAEKIFNILRKEYDIGFEHDFLNNNNDIGITFDTYRKNEHEYGSDEVSSISMIIPKEFKDIEKIKQFFTACGWTLAVVNPYYKDKDFFVYSFEKNRQEDMIKTSKYVYHLTPTNKLDKILKNGLTPHSGNKLGEHPERIYCFLDRNLDVNYTFFADELYSSTNNNKKRDVPYTLLEIDTEKCGNIKFYGDPNLVRAIWTFDNIPPEAIKVINKNI